MGSGTSLKDVGSQRPMAGTIHVRTTAAHCKCVLQIHIRIATHQIVRLVLLEFYPPDLKYSDPIEFPRLPLLDLLHIRLTLMTSKSNLKTMRVRRYRAELRYLFSVIFEVLDLRKTPPCMPVPSTTKFISEMLDGLAVVLRSLAVNQEQVRSLSFFSC